MKLHIKKSSLYMTKLLFYGGLAVIFLLFLCRFWRTTVAAGHMTAEWLDIILYVWFKEILFSGLILSAVGCVWKSRIYRCPICRNWILRFGGFSRQPSKYCSGCGTKIDVCIDGKAD